MFLIFISIIGVLKCQSTTDRDVLRTKLLDAQNLMQFDQVEFDRLWSLAMSYGNLFPRLSCINDFKMGWLQQDQITLLLADTEWAEKTGVTRYILFHTIFVTFVMVLVTTAMG